MENSINLQERSVNTIRFLSADTVQKANSGHPGLPMGAAAMAYTLWTRHLKVNPINPKWPDRDRFILSGGHGSALLYSLLFLCGYDVSMDDLKHFRQWNSITPGHPEYGVTPGVETTTGPLGQGFANGVGMAIAEAHLAAEFNRPGYELVNHYTYGIVTDGDLMEGVASEAASLAGHLSLSKLIYLYDDNRISIEGSTDLAFTEDRAGRFEAYGWQVLHVSDGNDVDSIDKAILAAKNDQRPSLIVCRTTIGFGLPTKAGTEKAHGEPPGMEELQKAKSSMGWPTEPDFYVPDDVRDHFIGVRTAGEQKESDWQKLFAAYQKNFPEKAAEFERRISGQLPDNWEGQLPVFQPDQKGMATRQSSGTVLQKVAVILPEVIGGSADLSPSNKTWIDGSEAIQPRSFAGRNIHFGVREHAMGAIVNGITYHRGLKPFGGTFLVFSDYMRPAIRISALSHLPSIWVFTHDSIGLGEDGPTHQPVEHLAALRAIPNLSVIRPADANEAREAWIAAVERKDGPTALVLSRQNLPTLDRNTYARAENLHRGAYILADLGNGQPQVILMASGSEVQLIIDAGKQLEGEGIPVRLVSFPSWDIFENQPISYQQKVLDPSIEKKISIEAGIKMGWEKWIGEKGRAISLERYGASAPGEILYKEFGLTVDTIIRAVKELLHSD